MIPDALCKIKQEVPIRKEENTNKSKLDFALQKQTACQTIPGCSCLLLPFPGNNNADNLQ